MSDEKMIMVGATENKPAVVHGMDGRFARVTPSLYLDGGVCVAFRTSTGEATVNAITFTAEEWDALYAAGNRALGRPEAMPRAVAVELANAIGSRDVGWSHVQVAALVRHLLLGGSLEDRPEVARVVEGARNWVAQAKTRGIES